MEMNLNTCECEIEGYKRGGQKKRRNLEHVGAGNNEAFGRHVEANSGWESYKTKRRKEIDALRLIVGCRAAAALGRVDSTQIDGMARVAGDPWLSVGRSSVRSFVALAVVCRADHVGEDAVTAHDESRNEQERRGQHD